MKEYLIYRVGSNAANQTRVTKYPVAIVRANTPAEAERIAINGPAHAVAACVEGDLDIEPAHALATAAIAKAEGIAP